MDRLDTALARIRPGLAPELPEPDPAELAALPPTAVFRAEVERLEALAEPGGEESRARREAPAVLGWWRRRLAWAERRDALVAARPEGCWCLGAGGRGRAALGLGEDGAPLWVWREHCGCPEGAAARERDRATADGHRRTQLQRRSSRLWASVPPEFAACTLESYPARTGPQRRTLARLREWQAGDRWLYLWGETGRGKTGLAVSLLRAAVERGQPGLCVVVPHMLERIRRTFRRDQEGGSEEAVMASLYQAEPLVLDDLGKERSTDWVAERLFMVIGHRHDHHKQTIITTNHPPDELAERIGEWTLWRIVQLAKPYLLHVEGPNLRD